MGRRSIIRYMGGGGDLGIPKKRSSKKFGGMWPKSNDFRHISEKDRLEQSFFRFKKAKKFDFRSINAKK